MNYAHIIFTLCLCFSNAYAQSDLRQISARASGAAYTASCIPDPWAVFNNPGGIAHLDEIAVLIAFENKYQTEGLNSMAAGVIIPTDIGTTGVTVFRFGDDIYNEQVASLSYANKFGIASLGVRLNYMQYSIESVGTKSVFTVDFGGLATITPHLSVGGYIRNLNQAQMAELAEERVPVILNAGISYQPTDKIMLNIETEKDIDYRPEFRTGIEYKFLEKLAARTGVKLKPFTNYFGIGLYLTKLSIDYAVTATRIPGISHQASVSWWPGGKK